MCIYIPDLYTRHPSKAKALSSAQDSSTKKRTCRAQLYHSIDGRSHCFLFCTVRTRIRTLGHELPAQTHDLVNLGLEPCIGKGFLKLALTALQRSCMAFKLGKPATPKPSCCLRQSQVLQALFHIRCAVGCWELLGPAARTGAWIERNVLPSSEHGPF